MVYYRYIARKTTGPDQEWKGLFQVLPPPIKRKADRFIHEPKWYTTHPNADTRCWLTEYGYERYHEELENLIWETNEWFSPIDYRLIVSRDIENIVMTGKVQCIQFISNKKDDIA